MDEEQIRTIILESLQAVANERPAFAVQFARENAVAARLFFHLGNRPEFAMLNVDSEYDRAGLENDPKTRPNGGEIRPDIIVHNRGNNDANLLAIEVKFRAARTRRTNDDGMEGDRDKLRDIERQYRYAFRVLVKLPRDLNNFAEADNVEFIPSVLV